MVCDRSDRLGQNGVDDFKAHPWMQGVDWDNLRNVVGPYVSVEEAHRASQVIDALQKLPLDHPHVKPFVKELTSKFDDFPHTPLQGGGRTHIAKGKTDFIGYTFKRKQKEKRTGVDDLFADDDEDDE